MPTLAEFSSWLFTVSKTSHPPLAVTLDEIATTVHAAGSLAIYPASINFQHRTADVGIA
jgi:hypothetical protein